MATCPACGAEAPADREFCPACLASVRVAPFAPASPAPDPVPTAIASEPDAGRPADAKHFLDAPVPAADIEHPCPLHPGYPVGGTCSRCGKFVCIRCDPDLATTAQPLCEACRVRLNREAPEGIGGWLWLPLISLVLSPVSAVVQIFKSAASVIDVTSRASPRTALAVVIGLEGFFFAAQFGYSIYVLVRFLQRRKDAPRLLIALYVGVFAFTVLDNVVVAEIGAGHWSGSVVAGRILRSMVGVAIWTPYLLTSRRVKKTFTR
jgi:hypothetical protein